MIVILNPNVEETSASYQDTITFLENLPNIHIQKHIV